MANKKLEEQILSLYNAGESSIRVIAKTTGLSKSGVHRIIKKEERKSEKENEPSEIGSEALRDTSSSDGYKEEEEGIPWGLILLGIGFIVLIIWGFSAGAKNKM